MPPMIIEIAVRRREVHSACAVYFRHDGQAFDLAEASKLWRHYNNINVMPRRHVTINGRHAMPPI